uniref:Uncharacterized protein n=1 Tax=Bionectria ochroleuca TaxID=29856 RepID=A0A8H7NDZ8_BIOOC
MAEDLDTSKITHWRSIVTLIVFVLTNINVLFPFHIPILVPKSIYYACLDCLSSLRIIPRRYESAADGGKSYVRLWFPMNLITAPLIADLFLLAILAIGRKEVHDGTIGTANISPLDIMIFSSHWPTSPSLSMHRVSSGTSHSRFSNAQGRLATASSFSCTPSSFC